MNIVYQLREHGTRNFRDIYEELKWIEAMDHPDVTEEEMVQKIDNFSPDKPRGFKTHSAPPVLPFRDDVKYVVVVRNPEEVVVSMKRFTEKHSPDFLEWWGLPPNAFSDIPDLDSFYNGFVKNSNFDKELFTFVKEWMKLRHKPNVLMIHYSDMVKDHEGSIKKISDFLGYGPYTPEEWEDVLELTSFPWMKKNEMKFEASTIWEVPALMSGAMMRQGSFGVARQEGITKEMAKEINERGRAILDDEGALNWMYNGGNIGMLDAVGEGVGESKKLEIPSDSKEQQTISQ